MATLTCSRFFDYTQKKVALGKSDKGPSQAQPILEARDNFPEPRAGPREPVPVLAPEVGSPAGRGGREPQRSWLEGPRSDAAREKVANGLGTPESMTRTRVEASTGRRRPRDEATDGPLWQRPTQGGGQALGETGRRKTASHPGAEAGLGGLKKKLHELANRVGSGTGSGHVQPEPPGTLPRCARAGQMRGGRGWYQDDGGGRERGDERWVGAGRLGPRPGSAPGPAAGRAAAVPDSPAASGRKSPDEFLSNSWLCEKKGGPHGETRTIPS
ncbi:unnamed protein product [Prorocentrum cordatum]|uniref:Uncharacterized protein n=1 Tax=Prorocentrum cordatum TaxID=2364126 RepID=A0ABN9VJD1_9DINO|nr:unnamed protein product [Polarella glacialis]